MAKRLLTCICLILIMFVCCSGVYAETVSPESELQGIDLSALSYDALLLLEQSVRLELMARPEGGVFSLEENAYLVGKDIPEGRYHFVFKGERTRYNSTDHMGWLLVYDTYAHYQNAYSYNSRRGKGDIVILTNTDSGECDLNTGNVLIVRAGPVDAERIGYIGKSEAYTPPAGTVIPAGYYIAGEEIPSGTYTVSFGGIDSAVLRTYENESIYSARSDYRDDYLTYIRLDDSNTQGTVHLKEGQVLYISDASVIMNRFKAFTFD
ncbi:MAG: hypothetical protein IKR85_00130 [Clostridia bacterium]|nr:hypothetical protein [Clostridia bacterium]